MQHQFFFDTQMQLKTALWAQQILLLVISNFIFWSLEMSNDAAEKFQTEFSCQ